MIKGITVRLTTKEQVGEDAFGAPIVKTVTADIGNVLVSPTSSQDNVSNMQLYGKMAAYTLAIPKGDTHNWQDATVEFFGAKWRTMGIPTKGIEELIPLNWNTKVQVERYE